VGGKHIGTGKYIYICTACLIIFSFLGCATVQRADGDPDARKHLVLGCRFLAEEDFGSALRENLKVLSTAAGSPYRDKALFNIGLIYAHYANPARDYEKSIGYFRRLLREYPKSRLAVQAEVWISMLEVLKKAEAERREAEAGRKELKREIAGLKQELKKKINTGKRILRSRRLLASGRYAEAVRENMKILSMPGSPFKDKALFNMGLIYAHFNNPDMDYKKSIGYFSKLISEYPQSPLAEQARIWINVLNVQSKGPNRWILKLRKRKRNWQDRVAMISGKILVIDDDSNLLEVIRMRLESANYEVVTALREEEAIEAVRKELFDLAIIDLQLARTDGISFMKDIHEIIPDLPVIILTAYGTIESAVEAMKKGAYSYLTKPFDPRELLLQIEMAMENRKLTSEIKRLKGLVEEKYNFANIIARSAKMQDILARVALIAKTDSTVYIYGESGTGKELIAKAIHLHSERRDKPFVAINCSALPETLLESELFGHEKGAFTGAVKKTDGLFTQADKGTIFLDEIGNMPLSLQSKSLRVLQEQQFYPLGSKKPVKVDVRVIVATNKDIKKEVREGRFREDLFYRIHVIPITLPPLRERKDDIPPLVNHFIKKFSKPMKKKVKGLTPLAMQKLMLHDWPGNVRELENTIEYAMAMTTENIISEDLILPASGLSPEPLKPLNEAKAEFEKNYIIHLLDLTKGNITRAAELAGRYRADFYNLLKKHGINPDDFKK